MKFDKEPIKVLARYEEDLPSTKEELIECILREEFVEQICQLCKDKGLTYEKFHVCMYYTYDRQSVKEELIFLRDEFGKIWEISCREDEETPTWYGYKEGKMFEPSTSVWKVFTT